MAFLGPAFTYTWEELAYHTPTRAVGISYEKELQLRKDTCLFIGALGEHCGMGQIATASASVYLQVFYSKFDFKAHNRHLMAATCVFLAGKVEERGKRVSKVVDAYFLIRAPPARSNCSISQPRSGDSRFEAVVQQIYAKEQLLLHVLEYNLSVQHPYSYLMRLITEVFGPKYACYSPAAKKRLFEKDGLAQTAWYFVHDSLRSTVCLQFTPDMVAMGVLSLALTTKKMVVTSKLHTKPWYEALYKKDCKTLDAIASQILRVVEHSPADPTQRGGEASHGTSRHQNPHNPSQLPSRPSRTHRSSHANPPPPKQPEPSTRQPTHNPSRPSLESSSSRLPSKHNPRRPAPDPADSARRRGQNPRRPRPNPPEPGAKPGPAVHDNHRPGLVTHTDPPNGPEHGKRLRSVHTSADTSIRSTIPVGHKGSDAHNGNPKPTEHHPPEEQPHKKRCLQWIQDTAKRPRLEPGSQSDPPVVSQSQASESIVAPDRSEVT